VSEGAIHTAVARARSGATATATATEADVWRILASIPDPELPVVSIVELGMVGRVEADSTGIAVTILPTFIGCPAIDLIHATVRDRLSELGPPVRVESSFEIPWTSDRITPAGRRALRAAGIAPPAEPGDMRCPHCDGREVVMDGAFGPTQCRSLYYCRTCRQPFEALKRV
jgi:ring-1,2-phenylacetyl-CoA epoxidase subunit PaaD